MKTIIAYFSWSNNTKKLVESIKKEMPELDVVRIERIIHYSDDYNECAYHEAKDEIDGNIHPEIKQLCIDFNEYDRILCFYPIWWYTFPMPVATFVEKLKGYQGEVTLFANSYTNDPQYMVNSLRDFRAIDKDIEVSQGLFNKGTSEHIRFIKGLEERK